MQSDHISRIEIEDAGDGSTSVKIAFEDGSTHYVNADTWPDGPAVSVRQADGKMSYPELYDRDGNPA